MHSPKIDHGAGARQHGFNRSDAAFEPVPHLIGSFSADGSVNRSKSAANANQTDIWVTWFTVHRYTCWDDEEILEHCASVPPVNLRGLISGVRSLERASFNPWLQHGLSKTSPVSRTQLKSALHVRVKSHSTPPLPKQHPYRQGCRWPWLRDTVNVVFTNHSPTTSTHYAFNVTLKFLHEPAEQRRPLLLARIWVFQFGSSSWHLFTSAHNCSSTIRTPKRSWL